MNTIQFSDFLITGPARKIIQIYTGRETGCRCGCSGRYFTLGEVGFTRALNKIRKLDPVVNMFVYPYKEGSAEEKRWIDWLAEHRDYQMQPGTCVGMFNAEGRGWIDLVLPNDRTITLYFEPWAANF